MLPYTICFIQSGSKILLLNRNKAPNMGLWNGVGGKIEAGESIEDSIKREILEETGLDLDNVEYRGKVIWRSERGESGMYMFVCCLDHPVAEDVAVQTREGILSWKELDWILDKENKGVVSNIPYYLGCALQETGIYEHRFTYKNGMIMEYSKQGLAEEHAPLSEMV
ncbi:NUDIX hydrolase [Bacillus testis]|uniref:NUDIX hydrolase n=1 Tax=Bacillus testis TaxID=1622072 RepID=UPI00067EE7E3|nr:8-oxo-dGTP diphosphatase [Bacillus testis]